MNVISDRLLREIGVVSAEVVTLCGSTRFKDEFIAENQRLTMEGRVVISVGVFGHTDLPDYDWTTDVSDLKRMLDGLHFQKIRMADRVHVIDPGGYIGESTAREVAYAHSLGKAITYLSRGGGRVAEKSESHRVSPDSQEYAGSRERLDPLAATSHAPIHTNESEHTMNEISNHLLREILNEHPNAVAVMIADAPDGDGEPSAYFAGRFDTPEKIEAFLFGILITHTEEDGYGNVVRKDID